MTKKSKIQFIAEIGLNHNGNFDNCYQLIKSAKEAGADICKFQLGWRYKKGELNYIDEPTLKKIISLCEFFEIELLFSVMNLESYLRLKKIGFRKYKIASRSLIDDINLIKKIIKDKNQLIVSLGMWNKKKLPFGLNKNIKYLWCKSKYPTYLEDLKDFPNKFDSKKYFGYSDHYIGIEMCLHAISKGAKIIEKHFTLNKLDSTIRDHVLSATPEEFKKLVDQGRILTKIYDKIR